MSVNVKLGNDTINGVENVKLRNADNNEYISFYPLEKLINGDIIVNFSYWQDFTGTVGLGIRWRLVLIGSTNWTSSANFSAFTFIYLTDWIEYYSAVSGDDNHQEQIKLHVDPTTISAVEGYVGLGILVDMDNSSYDSVNITFYPHYGEVILTSLNNPLNGYGVSLSDGYNCVCGYYYATSNNLRLYRQSGALRTGVDTTQDAMRNFNVVINFDVTGSLD